MREQELYQDPTDWTAVRPGSNSRGEKIINHLNTRELHGFVKRYEMKKLRRQKRTMMRRYRP